MLQHALSLTSTVLHFSLPLAYVRFDVSALANVYDLFPAISEARPDNSEARIPRQTSPGALTSKTIPAPGQHAIDNVTVEDATTVANQHDEEPDSDGEHSFQR